jgi:ribonuclease P protein component
MLKILHITKSSEFQKIGKKSEKFYSHTVLLLSASTPNNYSQNFEEGKLAKDFCRVGFTTSKAVSKSAVKRNLAKRRLREVFRELAPLRAKNNYDYVLIARRDIVQADFAKIRGDLKFCLERIHKKRSQPTKVNK